MRHFIASCAVALLVACTSQVGPEVRSSIPAHQVIGVTEAHLDPQFWVRNASTAERVVLDVAQIDAQNARLEQLDPSVHDLEQLPETLTREQVHAWMDDLSGRPTRPLYDESGQELDGATLDDLVASTAPDRVMESRPIQFGMVVRRADLRAYPTSRRVFYSKGNTDIDRFQESALFPGTPLAIVHESRDQKWWFVVSAVYVAWIEKSSVATGAAAEIFAYARKVPFAVITGAKARTVYTREEPAVSELQLEMGSRYPELTDRAPNQPVNGQHPYSAHVIELPVRNDDGSLRFVPALLPRTNDVASNYLPLTRRNLLTQSFKFLGERYGWGHSYNARDCSGFVSEVYRSFGVSLPRNTGDQGTSPALNRIAFDDQTDYAQKLAAVRESQIGDLIYIPGHVMMVIGRERGMPYVIHDTTGITYRNEQGEETRVRLNGVSVTPLEPLLIDDEPMIATITNIVRIRP